MPGCASLGRTEKEALANIKEAIIGCLGKLCTCGPKRAAGGARVGCEARGLALAGRVRTGSPLAIDHKSHLACGGISRWRTA
jgi:hypothetical protein